MRVDEPVLQQHRDKLLKIYHAAIKAVNGRSCVRAALESHPVKTPVYLVAIGKAAAAMTQGAFDVLGDHITAGLLITRQGYAQDIDTTIFPLMIVESGHPVPDKKSLEAGEALLQFIAAVPDDATLLFLISGGASALVEVLPEGVGIAELEKVNQWLLASGLAIAGINHIRTSLSCIKGGRLAMRLPPCPVLNLMISDVPDNNPAIIGSGLLLAECQQDSAVLKGVLPDWLRVLTDKAPSVPEADDDCFSRIQTQLVATSRDARAQAAMTATAFGYQVTVHEEVVTGDVLGVAQEIAGEIKSGPVGLSILGGECTVSLPPSPGRGGRCQSLALAIAQSIKGCDGLLFLAAATDGCDGSGSDAGALVDGGTIYRGSLDDMDAAMCIKNADAGSFLEASGDLINTGPTGTNVMDVMFGLKIDL